MVQPPGGASSGRPPTRNPSGQAPGDPPATLQDRPAEVRCEQVLRSRSRTDPGALGAVVCLPPRAGPCPSVFSREGGNFLRDGPAGLLRRPRRPPTGRGGPGHRSGGLRPPEPPARGRLPAPGPPGPPRRVGVGCQGWQPGARGYGGAAGKGHPARPAIDPATLRAAPGSGRSAGAPALTPRAGRGARTPVAAS